jgi:hypothetical protein
MILAYDAASRLHAFVPHPPYVEKKREIVEKVKKRTRGSKKVVMHVVEIEQLRVEMGVGPDVPVQTICESLRTTTTLEARYTAKSKNHANTLRTTWGDGHVIVYVLHGASYGTPQYLALGTTSGCRAEGLEMYGTWNVRSAFGGADNAYTPAALEASTSTPHSNQHDAIFQWKKYPCMNKTLASFHRPCFVKAYPKTVPDVSWDALSPVSRLQARALSLVKMLCAWGEL